MAEFKVSDKFKQSTEKKSVVPAANPVATPGASDIPTYGNPQLKKDDRLEAMKRRVSYSTKE